MSQNSRKLWLDIAKGIAIILMVCGHTTIPRMAFDFIYSFHMPLFFIASGYASNYLKRGPLEYIVHKSRTILLPFLTYSIIVSLILFAIGKMDFSHLIANGWEGYALWFIPVLYFASVIAMLASVAGKRIRYVCMLCLFLLGYGLSYFKVHLPWTLSTVPYAAFLVLVRNEMKHAKKWVCKNHYYDVALLFVVTAVVSHFYRLDLAWNHIIPVIQLTIGAIAGTLLVFRLSVWMERNIKWCAMLLQKVGRETYVVVAFSQVTIMAINHFFIEPATEICYSSYCTCLVEVC